MFQLLRILVTHDSIKHTFHHDLGLTIKLLVSGSRAARIEVNLQEVKVRVLVHEEVNAEELESLILVSKVRKAGLEQGLENGVELVVVGLADG